MLPYLTWVLEGEYESGYVGEGLRVLDIGANAGAFSIWAAHRWPGSTIDAYEPSPSTFALLQENTRSYPMIRCHNLAVYPSAGDGIAFTSRYPGDGEAGIVECLADTFNLGNRDERDFFDVPALHPRELPSADIVKIDAEGAEAEIVKHANFSAASLLLMEYQYSRNLQVIKAHLATEFEPIVEHSFIMRLLCRRARHTDSLWRTQTITADTCSCCDAARRGFAYCSRLPRQSLRVNCGSSQKAYCRRLW